MRILSGLILLTLAGIAVLLAFGVIRLPPAFLPWMPLAVRDEPNFLTRYKLARLNADPALCRSALQGSDLRHTPVPDRLDNEGCGFTNVVRVTGSGLASSEPFLATCPLAVSWAMFERHALQPAAQQHFGQPVARVAHFGTYACRNINHREGGRRSEHATANAIDIAAFKLRDGREISLLTHWNGSDPRASAFLRQARDGACRFFGASLGPDYNFAHRDHFHFDTGRFRACR